MLATHLRLLREKNGLTQKQVADMLNIDRSTYAYYESGKTRPDILTIAKLDQHGFFAGREAAHPPDGAAR